MANSQKESRVRAPLSDAIIVAVAKLVDDAQSQTREPSHSDIEYQINRAGLSKGDPKATGQLVGKAKRVRGTLHWAGEHDPDKGGELVASLLALVRGCGGFRADAANYVGQDAISSATAAFRAEGFLLASDGQLTPVALDTLSGAELTDALKSYVRRAKQGVMDAALLVGTSKDLLEATAAHVLTVRFGNYSPHANFPTLLGQAFIALDLATPHDPVVPGERAQRRLERAFYEVGCAVNALRNKDGTGHGRPWLTGVTESEARVAAESIGVIAEFLLIALERR